MEMISKFYKWGIYGNRFLWFHLYAGCFGYWLGGNIGLALWLTSAIVLICAVAWERFEFQVECGGDWAMVEKVYGSVERWTYDTAGDIIVPLVLGIVFWWRF
jgi:hypothetical protein